MKIFSAAWINCRFPREVEIVAELISCGSTEMFPTVCSFDADKTLLSVIEKHLNAPLNKLKEYFGSSVEDLD
jgi:hypothetical protein